MATKYSDIMALREQKAAYNIEHEQHGDWASFIANEQFNDILRKVIASVRNNDTSMHKSFWISGTYGTGKSHAGAVIKHLLCDKVEDIADYIHEEYKAEKHQPLQQELLQLREQKRLFPIMLYGQSGIAHKEDLSLQLQRSISTTLHKAGIEISVQTDFDTYVNHIENDNAFWEDLIAKNGQLKSVAPTCKKLITELKNGDLATLAKVRQALRERDIDIRLANAKLPQWFFEVQEKLAAEKARYGYDGLLVIWDEFTDVMTSDMGLSLLTALQEVDERVMNPNNNSYFLYISHPSALNSLKDDEREKTKGRYHYMGYNMEPVSAFKIMSRKFKVLPEGEETYNTLCTDFFGNCGDLLNLYTKSSNDPEETKRDIQSLFPLHPSTANLATYYAREAGSSSRSVFQFIGENAAIRQFLESEEHFQNRNTINADYLWDYVLDEFNASPKFGMVTERFNSRKLKVEAKGADYYAVFKSILLLNALNNIANNETVTPSGENIKNLFVATSIEPHLTDILNYFDENSIIQRQPGGLFSIQFSALPTKEIEDIKLRLMLTEFKFTKQIVNWGITAKQEIEKFLSNVARAKQFMLYSVDASEHTLLSQIENGYKQAKPYELFMAILFARNASELNMLKEIAAKASAEERFQNVVFIVFEALFTDRNYERFIEYLANANCASNHGFAEQTQSHNKNATEMIKDWMSDIRRGNFTYYLRGEQEVCATSKIASTINSVISPTIFSKGVESLAVVQSTFSKTYWAKVSAKQVVDSILQYTTKTDIVSKCVGPTRHIPLLLQDSVDENLEWKSDIDKNHPLYLVCEFIDKKFKHTDKSQPFNLGDKLIDLTKPPYGLYQSYAGMGMVAFAMRKYVKQIFDLNGKPRDVKHIVEDVVEIFKTWEAKKSSNKLEFRFETKESRSLCDNLIKTFKLNTLHGYNDISSLTDARWAITHEFSKNQDYPLWVLKYTNQNIQDGLKTLIDNILKICGDIDMRNPDLINNTLNGMERFPFELGNLLLDKEAFKRGFIRFLKSLERVNLQDGEIDEAGSYLKQHLQAEVGLWTESEVEQSLKNWRLEKVVETPPITPPITPPNTPIDPPSPPRPSSPELPKKREIAKTKIRQISSVYSAKKLLEKICENADDLIMDIINNYDNE